MASGSESSRGGSKLSGSTKASSRAERRLPFKAWSGGAAPF